MLRENKNGLIPNVRAAAQLYTKNCIMTAPGKDLQNVKQIFQMWCNVLIGIFFTIFLFQCVEAYSIQKISNGLILSRVGECFVSSIVLCVQKVATLQKKYLIYLHHKMRFTPFINYYDSFK